MTRRSLEAFGSRSLSHRVSSFSTIPPLLRGKLTVFVLDRLHPQLKQVQILDKLGLWCLPRLVLLPQRKDAQALNRRVPKESSDADNRFLQSDGHGQLAGGEQRVERRKTHSFHLELVRARDPTRMRRRDISHIRFRQIVHERHHHASAVSAKVSAASAEAGRERTERC